MYYFAGNPTDNWFYFGGYYWRIVRTNGDGSIRLIYNGTSTSQIGNSTMINASQAFNITYNNNAFVGYMYENEQIHGLQTDSSIKTKIDNWYKSNLVSYAGYLDGNAGFCGDRTPSTNSSSSNGSGGVGGTRTYYGAYIRLVSSKKPSFKCTNESDLYTTPGSSKGNEALKAVDNTETPIGLISVDEVAFAGGVNGTSNTSYYLYNNANYWTISPYYFDDVARVFYVWSDGNFNALAGSGVVLTYGVRPVINLKATIALSGSGTTSDPFKIQS